jgi:hypothetical protein
MRVEILFLPVFGGTKIDKAYLFTKKKASVFYPIFNKTSTKITF